MPPTNEELLAEILKTQKEILQKEKEIMNKQENDTTVFLEVTFFVWSGAIAMFLVLGQTSEIILKFIMGLYFFVGFLSLMMAASPELRKAVAKQSRQYVRESYALLNKCIGYKWVLIPIIAGSGIFLLGLHGLFSSTVFVLCVAMIWIGTLSMMIGGINYLIRN